MWRTAQLESTNQELEAFAYSVSHDLRAPLRSLEGFTGALLSDYQSKLDDQGKHYLGRIQEASRRMSHLIDDLLNLSRINRYEMKLETVDLSSTAQRIAGELAVQAPERVVLFKIAPNLVVKADKKLMDIAMENLLNNAFKFTSKQESAVIQVGVIKKAGKKTFYVRDNGVGFDMTYSEKLFTPFQRLHSTQDYPGTGIGLVIVKRIITKHGGRVWTEAEVNKGATFYFTMEVQNEK
jgi:light-regulated signal transduction histidine kinase (bacteriophytochrome)